MMRTRGRPRRLQPWVPIPKPSEVRPASYLGLAQGTAVLKGKRLGVPRMYINKDELAGTSEKPGIGGPTGQRIHTRASVIALWEAAAQGPGSGWCGSDRGGLPAGIQLRGRPPRRADRVQPRHRQPGVPA